MFASALRHCRGRGGPHHVSHDLRPSVFGGDHAAHLSRPDHPGRIVQPTGLAFPLWGQRMPSRLRRSRGGMPWTCQRRGHRDEAHTRARGRRLLDRCGLRSRHRHHRSRSGTRLRSCSPRRNSRLSGIGSRHRHRQGRTAVPGAPCLRLSPRTHHPAQTTLLRSPWPPIPRILNKKTDRIPASAYYCGRPGPLGNPFIIGRNGTRDEVCDKFEIWLPTQPKLMALVATLEGRDLVCWCDPFR